MDSRLITQAILERDGLWALVVLLLVFLIGGLHGALGVGLFGGCP